MVEKDRVRELAERVVRVCCEDSLVWRTHGRPSEFKLERIECYIEKAIRDALRDETVHV